MGEVVLEGPAPFGEGNDDDALVLRAARALQETRLLHPPQQRREGARVELQALAEIADEPWIEVSESDPVWCAFWRLTALRSEPPRVGASGESLEDLLEAARTRQAIGVVPECVARAQPWPQLTFARVTDIPPSDVAVAWRAAETSPPVSEFIAIAREFAAGGR